MKKLVVFSELYKNNLVALTKKALQEIIALRSEALQIRNDVDLSDKTEKEYREFKPSYQYYSQMMNVYQNIDERHKHINTVLNSLQKEAGKLENSILTYKAIDE